MGWLFYVGQTWKASLIWWHLAKNQRDRQREGEGESAPWWRRGPRAEGARLGAQKPELMGREGGEGRNPPTPQDLRGSAGHGERSG